MDTADHVNQAMTERINAVLQKAADGWALSPLAQPELPPPMPPMPLPPPVRPVAAPPRQQGTRLTSLLLAVLLLLLLLGIVCVITLPRGEDGTRPDDA